MIRRGIVDLSKGSAPPTGQDDHGRTSQASIFGLQGGIPMTFDQCQQALILIRRKQGTRYPLVRIDYGGAVYQGRLARADSDPEYRSASNSPYGVLVLEQLGLTRGPETILQIADIPHGGLKPLEEQ
jgi:hypothetical protein